MIRFWTSHWRTQLQDHSLLFWGSRAPRKGNSSAGSSPRKICPFIVFMFVDLFVEEIYYDSDFFHHKMLPQLTMLNDTMYKPFYLVWHFYFSATACYITHLWYTAGTLCRRCAATPMLFSAHVTVGFETQTPTAAKSSLMVSCVAVALTFPMTPTFSAAQPCNLHGCPFRGTFTFIPKAFQRVTTLWTVEHGTPKVAEGLL